MSASKAELKRLSYNPARQRFEGLVVFTENGKQISYPTDLKAPVETDLEKVSRDIMLKARINRARDAGDTRQVFVSHLRIAAANGATENANPNTQDNPAA